MNKSLLAAIFLSFPAVLSAQSSVKTLSLPAGVTVKENVKQPAHDGTKPAQVTNSQAVARPKGGRSTVFHEAVIGTSYYDLQTNSTVSRRLSNNGDGTLSAVWTMSQEQVGGAHNDRGAGYNYFNGTSWMSQPTTRIENDRTGWPSINVTANGNETVIAHNTNQSQLHVSRRTVKGTGTWNQSTSLLTSPATGGSWWPSSAVGGANGNTIHLISLTYPVANGGALYNGQDGAILYSRSTDGGATWGIIHDTLPGIGPNFYNSFSADDYSIDARGDEVAIAIGTGYNGVILLRSDDNGATWTKTVVDPFPIPNYDFATMMSDSNGDNVADTILMSDGSISVLIDNNNKAHLWYGQIWMLDDNSNTGYVYWVEDGLNYWNENMGSNPPVVIAGVQDRNGNGTIDASFTPLDMGVYGVGMASMPTSGIDAAGTIYLAYVAAKELTDDGYSRLYRSIYVTKSSDNGTTWCDTVTEIYVSDFDELVFPSMARNVDTTIHMIYQRDGVAGHAFGQGTSLDAGNEDADEIIYTRIPVTAICSPNPVSVAETAKQSLGLNVFPNPASESVNIRFSVSGNTATTVVLHNTMGQKVAEFNNQAIAGNQDVMIDIASLPAGVYVVTVNAADRTEVAKFIKE